MAQTMLHEHFCRVAAWAEESLGVYVASVEHKGSFSGGMPVRNELGDVVLVFSGEDFPDPGTAERLHRQGHSFTSGDASYLVHRYEDDSSFPAGLNGRFHGLVADRNRGETVLFNDRYGMHRLYYCESKDTFYFAAEAKALLAIRPELRSIDPKSLGEFVSCGAVLENRTIFDRIHVLPPASAWVFENGSLLRKSSYFSPREWEEQDTLELGAYYRELRETFTRNLSRYFEGEAEVGMSLTGGLDSRMILASQNPEPRSLRCYTFGSMFRENGDVRVGRRVAQACNQSHQVITAGQEFLSQFQRYAERAVYLADGCVDVGRAPDLYLNEKAREIAPVRVTGTYGGEILRGVRSFKPADPAPGLFSPGILPYLQQAAETYESAIQGNPVSVAVFKQAPWHQYNVLALEQTQLTMRAPFLDNDFVRTVFRSPSQALRGNEISLRLIADGSGTLLRIPTDRGLAGNRGRVTGAASRGILEFLFKAEYACDIGMPQWLAGLDRRLSPVRLERFFLGRHKVFHFRVWYRDALAGYVRDVLLDPRSLSRPYVERKRLEAIVQGHLKGNRNYTGEIHHALTLELIHRLFLDHPERGRYVEDAASARVTAQFATAVRLAGGATLGGAVDVPCTRG